MNAGENLALAVDGSREWTLKLIADVSGDEWTFQPQEGVQHILWLCGHLACAEALLVLVRVGGGDNPDPEFSKHFPVGGPVASAGEYDYPLPAAVRERMAATHDVVLEAIRGMNEQQLNEPCYGKHGKPHPHYTTKRGAIDHCVRHEGFHAGQIAMLRRLMGKPFLR